MRKACATASSSVCSVAGANYTHSTFIPSFQTLFQSTSCYLIRGTLLVAIQNLLSSSALQLQEEDRDSLQQLVMESLSVVRYRSLLLCRAQFQTHGLSHAVFCSLLLSSRQTMNERSPYDFNKHRIESHL